ncbi:MAG: recombinase family protein [Oscillospiraceae bacterium]
MIYGYARVSTKGQNLATQVALLSEFKVDLICKEKISGKSKTKNILENLLIQLIEGDILVITRMDRLGRSTVELLKLVELFEQKKIHLVILNLGVDTRTPTGKFFLTIFAAIGELEWDINREKQRQGIELAKKRGVYRGRPKKYGNDNIKVKHALELRKTTNKSVREIAKLVGISESTLYRRTREQ